MSSANRADGLPARSQWFSRVWIYVVLGIIGTLLLGALAISTYLGGRIEGKLSPRLNTFYDIRDSALTAHIWFAEERTGEKPGSIDRAWKCLDKAESDIQILLRGGVREGGYIPPALRATLRTKIENLGADMASFRKIAEEWYRQEKEGSLSRAIDVDFHSNFDMLLADTDDLEVFLVSDMTAERLKYRKTQYFLIFASGLFLVIAGVVSYRFDVSQTTLQIVKQARDQALESEENLARAQAIAKLGHWTWTTSEDEIKGSAEFYRLFGVEPEQMRTFDQFRNLLVSEDRDKAAKAVEDALAGVRPYDIEYRICLPSGTYADIHAQGEVVRDTQGNAIQMTGTVQDITDRKLAEKSLRETNDYLDNLFNYANAPIIVWDPESRITRFNHAFEKLTGRTAGEVIGKKLDILFPQALVESSMELIKKTLSGERWETVDISIQNADGTARTVLWNSATIFATDGVTPVAIIAQGQDITERKLAEKSLRETNDYLDNLFNYANAPIIVWDPEFRVTRFNHAFEKLTGKNAGEVIGKKLDILFPQALVESSMELIKKTLSGERWETVDIGILHVDGTVRTVLWNSATIFASDGATPVAIIAQGHDITDRKLAENALRESEVLFRSTFEQAALGVVQCQLDGKFVRVNQKFTEILGYSQDELMGMNYQDITYPYDLQADVMQMERLLAGNIDTYSIEKRYIRKDSSTVWVNITVSLIKDAAGKPKNLIKIVEDITWRRRAEEKLHKTMEDLARSNRELEQFAYVASHDLQEPLRMVGSFTQLLAKRYKGKLDSDADEFIEFAVDGANRMQKLINDLLIYSRINTRGREFEETGCEEVLGRVLANLQFAIVESGTIVTHDPLPVIKADGAQLLQLFQNLIGNAIKFRGDKTPEIHVGAEEKDRECVFSVKDNGIGIDPQYFDKVFVIFQRLHGKNEYSGTGIGLAVSKSIVERHGGKIWIESTPGKGSTFFFSIPRRS